MSLLTFMTQTIFDHGSSTQITAVLKSNKVKRPLICTDQGLRDLGMVANLTASIGNDIAVTTFEETPENPTQEAVIQATKIYEKAE